MENFKLSAHEDLGDSHEKEGFDLLPDGWYDVLIKDAEHKETKAKIDGRADKGMYASVEYVLDGNERFDGRRVWDNVNLQNDNPQAELIGKKKIQKLIQTIGVEEYTGPASIAGSRVRILVGTEKGTKGYSDKNKVVDFKKTGTVEGFKHSEGAPF